MPCRPLSRTKIRVFEMKRAFDRIWAAFAMLLLSALSFGFTQADHTSLASELRPSIVSIISYDKKKNVIARGTGFFTNKDEILTRRSVIANAHRVEVKAADEKVYRVVRTSREDLKADLALIVIEMPRELVKPLVYQGTIPQVSERVFVLSGTGREQELLEGSVAAVEESALGQVIRVSAQSTTPVSGAPVFNAKGELIATALPSQPGDLSFLATFGQSLTGIIARPVQNIAVDKKPKQLNAPQPTYTTQARRNGVEGEVVMRILIGEDGKVLRANVTKGLPDGLDDQALNAVYQLKFEPAMKDGIPVKYWISVIIEFRLRKR